MTKSLFNASSKRKCENAMWLSICQRQIGKVIFIGIRFLKGHHFYNSMNKNCILEAYRLQLANKGQGKVYYVVRLNAGIVGHAYYIPDPKRLEAIALNQADNGFSQFPRLTVGEVLKNNNPRYLLVTAD